MLKFEQSMIQLDEYLHSDRTEFTVVTVPTELASAETGRLLSALAEEGVGVRRVLVNQVLPAGRADAYLDNVRRGQGRAVQQLQTLCDGRGVSLLPVPYFDTEVRTVYGLRAISRLLLPE